MIGFKEDTEDASDRIRALGKRVEKIIFLGLILSLISSALFFLSRETQKTRVEDLILIIEQFRECAVSEKDTLIAKYDAYKSYEKTMGFAPVAHVYSISVCQFNIFDSFIKQNMSYYSSYKAISSILDKAPVLEYEKIDGYLVNLKNKFENEPLRIQGVEFSRSIDLSIFGNKIKTDFGSLLYPVKFVYTIVLFLWLLSFKRSRSIEIRAIKLYAKDITYVYPHFLNTYGISKSRILKYPLRIQKRVVGKKTHLKFPDANAWVRITYTTVLFLIAAGPFYLTFLGPFILDGTGIFVFMLLLTIISLLISSWIEFDSFQESIIFGDVN